MPKHILYVYVDGRDLEGVASKLEPAIDDLLWRRTWIMPRPTLVNQKHAPEAAAGPGDLPGWDLGINLDVPDIGKEPDDWLDDVEFLVIAFWDLRKRFGQDFVLGIFEARSETTEDLGVINHKLPKIADIKKAILVFQLN